MPVLLVKDVLKVVLVKHERYQDLIVIVNAVYNATTDKTTIIIQDPMPGIIGNATYAVEFASENDNTYLETFINFANRFCANCMVTGPAPTPITPATPSLEILKSSLTSETGIIITTEFNQKITI